VTFLYFKLAAAGILGGCVMILSGLEMYWQGAAAVVVGLIALSLGISNVVRAPRSLDREEIYNPKDFPRLDDASERAEDSRRSG
jgi:hypothetical protein